MTCMKQEFCIHEKYCQRHIGQNFDSCILFSRNSKPMTNEEWLRSCSTEELAEILRKLTVDAFDDCRKNNEYWTYHDNWVEWLQEKHQ